MALPLRRASRSERTCFHTSNQGGERARWSTAERGRERYSRGRRIGVYEKIPDVPHTDARQVCTLAVRQIPSQTQRSWEWRGESETWKKQESSDFVQLNIFWVSLKTATTKACF